MAQSQAGSSWGANYPNVGECEKGGLCEAIPGTPMTDGSTRQGKPHTYTHNIIREKQPRKDTQDCHHRRFATWHLGLGFWVWVHTHTYPLLQSGQHLIFFYYFFLLCFCFCIRIIITCPIFVFIARSFCHSHHHMDGWLAGGTGYTELRYKHSHHQERMCVGVRASGEQGTIWYFFWCYLVLALFGRYPPPPHPSLA